MKVDVSQVARVGIKVDRKHVIPWKCTENPKMGLSGMPNPCKNDWRMSSMASLKEQTSLLRV